MSSDPYSESLTRSSRHSRSSRYYNPLLLRQPIGKAKPSCFDLPPSSFTYGGRNQYDEHAVRDVLSHWEISQPSIPTSATVNSSSTNFISLNRSAAHYGARNSKQFKEFRETQQEKLHVELSGRSQPSPTRRSRSSIPLSLKTSNKPFGRPSKPSTPLHDILTHSFQRQAILANREKEAREADKRRSKRLSRREPSSPTRASLGHTKKENGQVENQQNDVSKFVMKRFANIPSKVETYRDHKQNERMNQENQES
jgi:hypothetical protein